MSNLSNNEKECLLCNRRVIDLLFESMDKDFADSIKEEKKFSKIHLDAYSLWQLLEAMCKEDSDDEDQEEDEGSLEENTTSENHTHPLVAPSDDQGRKGAKSAGSLWEPVRPVCMTGQTGLTRGQRKESKKCSRRRSRHARASYESTSSNDVDHKCLTAEIKKGDNQGVEQAMKFKEELDKLKIIYAS